MRIISHNRGLSAPDASGDRVVRGRGFGLIRWNERCCIRGDNVCVCGVGDVLSHMLRSACF